MNGVAECPVQVNRHDPWLHAFREVLERIAFSDHDRQRKCARRQRIADTALPFNDERPLRMAHRAPLERADEADETIGAATNDVAGRFADRRNLGSHSDHALARLATSVISVNAAASRTARSASILRSTWTPAAVRPWISLL